ncbi:uncharacterized protein LOC121379176 [Gigantopelta aegis]|uniref:uncharacterized protein LOC121379176 n=1 Tax=Gigantopelta aegis TaxID=1735272 RepID=UPI001B889AF8|nr:uncharacterized protein LOC121379176 [Gigantopelta aegis]
MIRMYGICLTVIALAVTVNAATKGAEISADSEFQKFRSQSSIRCSNNVGTGNQESKLLNTDAKRQAFRQKLTAEQQTFFDKLVNSPDHSVDTFTGDQLMMPLWKVMEDLTDSDRDMFIDIRSKWDTVTYDELVAFLGKIRPVELLVVKKELLCELTGKLDEAALDVVCGRVANDSVTDSEMAIAFEDRCSDCVALAWKKRASDNVRAIVSGAKGAFLYEKMAQTIPADQWDVNGLMLAPDAVTPEDVNRVPDANFCDSTQRDRLTKSEFHSVVSEDVKKAVARKLAKCSDLQDVGSWSAANIKKLSPYLANLPKTSLFKIKVSDAVDSLNELFALDKKTAEVIFKAMAPKLITYWTVNKAWTANQKTKILCIMVKYAPNKRFFEKVATVDDLKAFLRDKETQCPGQTFDSKEMRPITDRVASDDTFKWESDSFSDFGSSISSLSSSDLKKVNKSVICSDWDKVKDAHFKTQDLKHLWNVCKMEKSYSLGSFTCDKVKSIGVFLQAMTKAEIDEIPVNTLADCAEQVGKALNDVCKTNKGVCRAVWNRVGTGPSGIG